MGDTETQAAVAGANQRGDTRIMGSPLLRGLLLAAMCLAALPAFADEIRLKDGKKLYGVIVSYEENMFKVKTDFGYVLVEKDKIASIIPTVPASSEAQPATKNPADSAKISPNAQRTPETASGSAADAAPSATNASAKSIIPNASKPDKAATKISGTPVKPEIPAGATISEAHAPALKGSPSAANAALPPATAQPAPPK